MLKKKDNHVGILLCFLVIVFVILFNFNTIFNFIFQNSNIYNKHNSGCKKNSNNKIIEKFTQPNSDTLSNGDSTGENINDLSKCKLNQEDIKLTINSEKRSVDVSFYSNTDCMNDSRFYGYDLVLAKYNSNLKNIGHLEVKVLGHIGNSLLAKLRNIKDPNDNKIFKNADFGDISIVDGKVELNNNNPTNTNPISFATTNKNLTDKTVLSKVNLERLLKNLLEYKFHYDIMTPGVGQEFDDTYELIREFSGSSTENKIPELSVIMNTTAPTNGNDTSLVSDLDDLDNMRRRLQIEVGNLNLNKYSVFYTYVNLPKPDSSTDNDNNLLSHDDRKFIVKNLLNYLINLKSQKNQYCNPHTNLCSYEFTNLEMRDDVGNDIFYKLGFRTLLSGDISNKHYETKYITKDVPYFKLNEPINMQREFLETAHLLKDMKNKPIVKKNVEEVKTKTDLENYMQQFLGNYPNELKLKQEEIDEMSLSKYMNESLAQGEVNFNIGIDKDLNEQLNNQLGDAGVFDL